MALVIDQKTDSHTFGFWPIKENIDTTLKLVEESTNVFNIYYDVNYSGVKSGHAAGGPVAVPGNGTWTVPNNPVNVDVTISNYSIDGNTKTISMHITVVAHSGLIGDITLFDETLGGKYGTDPGEAIINHITLMANLRQPA